jgi:hypothetical protein
VAATKFICPDGCTWEISDCLNKCRMHRRCMFLPTLRAIAQSLDRKLSGFSVTELISGTREAYLKKTTDYTVDPKKRMFAMHGTAFHAINEGHTYGNIIAEERIYGDICSGQPDQYGELVSDEILTLGDLKVTSSYKIMKALGYYKIDVPTGETYKSGEKKGQQKTVKKLCSNGVRHVLDWAIQLNFYRTLYENEGYKVDDMTIQAMCRDFSLQIAASRGVTQEVYLIPINRISDRWIKKYLRRKAQLLREALETKIMPKPCSKRERWGGKKCAEYCEVSEFCDCIDAKGALNEMEVG